MNFDQKGIFEEANFWFLYNLLRRGIKNNYFEVFFLLLLILFFLGIIRIIIIENIEMIIEKLFQDIIPKSMS